MIFNFYFKIPKRFRVAVLFLLILLLAYFFFRFTFAEPKEIPPEFLKARQEASLISRDIVSFSGESASKMNEIAELDRTNKHTEALVLISQEIERNKKAREKAIELSIRLETMVRNINGISPASASQKALEALSLETTLINRLIIYNDYLLKLLEVLREKFLGRSGGNQVPELITKINDEARTINDLDRKFNEAMAELDNGF